MERESRLGRPDMSRDERRKVHDVAVRYIAATRFPFPGQKDWPKNHRTITNETTPKVGIKTGRGYLYPDIVVVDNTGAIRELGEVEKEDSVGPDEVKKWRLYSESTGMGKVTKKFFLYVPEGKEKDAQKLLKENKIEFAGLRTYSVLKEGKVSVTPVVTIDA